MRRAVVVCVMLALVVAVTGCGRTTDRMALAAYEPDERAAGPAEHARLPRGLERSRHPLPSSRSSSQAVSSTSSSGCGRPRPPARTAGRTWSVTGCSVPAAAAPSTAASPPTGTARGTRGRPSAAATQGPGGTSRSSGSYSYVVTADGSLRIVEPAERVTADCVAAWNTTPLGATWNRLRRAPYSLAIVAIRAAAATCWTSGAAGSSSPRPGLEVLEVDGTWRRNGLTWVRHGTAGMAAARARERARPRRHEPDRRRRRAEPLSSPASRHGWWSARAGSSSATGRAAAPSGGWRPTARAAGWRFLRRDPHPRHLAEGGRSPTSRRLGRRAARRARGAAAPRHRRAARGHPREWPRPRLRRSPDGDRTPPQRAFTTLHRARARASTLGCDAATSREDRAPGLRDRARRRGRAACRGRPGRPGRRAPVARRRRHRPRARTRPARGGGRPARGARRPA